MVRISSSIHTRIANSLNLRKELLEAELKTVELLQDLKKLKKAKEEKINLIAQFKREVSSVSDAIDKLEFEDLPMDNKRERVVEEVMAAPQKKIKREIEEDIAQDELVEEVQNLKDKIEALKI